MSRGKLFIENMLVYGFGGVVSKLIPIIMVPIITRLMPDTSYYGLSDLCITILSFGNALAVMGMYDAMFRYFFEKEKDVDYQKRVCSTAIGITLVSSLCVFLAMLVTSPFIAKTVLKDKKYIYLVFIAAIGAAITGTNSIIAAPTRMRNKRKVYLIVNLITPVIAYGLAIPLIINGYYIIALPLSMIIADISVIFINYFLNKEWFSLKKIDKQLVGPLLKMSVPLAPTFLIYWIFNSSDKIMISGLLNVGQVGIYSAGAKLGHCSQIIYLAFAGGWSYFAFKTMKDDDQVELKSRILEYLGAVSFIMAMLVFCFAKPLMCFIFEGDYEQGFIVTPYLFMAPLVQMLFQVAGNQFTIIKKTWVITLTTFLGAILNIVLNMILIATIGIEGAAIASLLGYVFSFVLVSVILLRKKMIFISKRFLVMISMMVTYIVLWRIALVEFFIYDLLVVLIFICIYVYLYRVDLKALVKRKKQSVK